MLLWPIAILATLLSAGLSIVYLPVPAVDYVLESDLRERAELWQRRVVLHLDDSENTFRTGALNPEEHEFLELLPEASDVHRFKLFHANGDVFWSTRPEDIGTTLRDPFFKEQVANGTIYYMHEAKPASEIDDLQLHARNTSAEKIHEVAEIYVPMMQNGEFIGAIEFFTDITEMRELFIKRVQMTLIALSALALLVLIAVGFMVWQSNRARYLALRSKAENERDLMDRQLTLAQEVKLLGELNEWLQSSRSLGELFDMVGKFLRHMLPGAAGSIYVYSNSRDVLDGMSAWNGGKLKKHIHPESCWALRRGRTYTYGVSEVDFHCEHVDPEDDSPYFCFPLLAHGETVGLMHLKKHDDVTIESFLALRKQAQMCAEQISMAIANVRMRDLLQEQSIRDPLTGLFNRRHMIDRMRHLIDLTGKKSNAVHVVYLDLDHFKRFNDTHGHDAGDFVLRAVGEVLDATCVDDDVPCRIGGEEFVLLWPGLTKAELHKRVDVLCNKISGLALNYQTKTLPKVTASVGVASAPEHGNLPQDILRAADQAMYDAKANGRDQVVYFGNDQNAQSVGSRKSGANGINSGPKQPKGIAQPKGDTTEIAAE